MTVDQLGDRRARHQHTLIDDEGQTAEPGLAQQVGGGYALFDAALEQRLQVGVLVVFQAAIEIGVGDFPRQVQRAEHQLAGFIPGIVGAVAEEQLLGLKTTDGPADVITQGT